MSRFVLHIGMSKTATSTLQQAVFQQHSEIFYLGKLLKNSVAKGARTPALFELLEPLLWKQKSLSEPAQHADAWRKLVSDPLLPGQLALGSWEALAGMNSKRFEVLLDTLQVLEPGYRLLVALRHPEAWIRSLYLQQVQGQFLKGARGAAAERPLLDLYRWIDSFADAGTGSGFMLRPFANVRRAVEVLGSARVGVFLFEQLREDPAAYYRGLAGFLGIKPEETLRLAQGVLKNPSLTQAELDFIRALDAGLLSRRRWRQQDRKARRLALKNAAWTDQRPQAARVEFNGAIRERIAGAVRSDLRWLQQELGLSLDRYAYPL